MKTLLTRAALASTLTAALCAAHAAIAAEPLAASPAAGQAEATTPQGLVETALRYLGYPYRYGQRGARGFDCSGFVQHVFAERGFPLPRTASAQAAVGEPVAWSELQPGDLIFFTERPHAGRISHVGIAVDAEHMVHASTGRGEVVVDTLSLRYYADRRAEARRVLGAPFVAIAASAEDGEVELEEPLPLTRAPSDADTAAPAYATSLGTLARAPTATLAVGVRGGLAALDGASYFVLSPTLRLRAEGLDLEAALTPTLAWSTADGTPLWRYDSAPAALRLLERLRLGRPENRAYLELARDLELTLGEGLLVRSARQLPGAPSLTGVPVHAAPSLAARGVPGPVDVQLVTDDVRAPTVLGARAGSTGRLSVAATLAADPHASSRRGGARGEASLDAGLRLVDEGTWRVSADLTLGAADTRSTSLGAAAGGWLTLVDGVRALALRGAVLAREPAFVPGLFGPLYGALRRTPEEPEASGALWDELDALSRTGGLRWGWAAAARLELTRRLSLRVDGTGDFAPSSGRPGAAAGALSVAALARDLALGRGGRSTLSLFLAYHQQGVRAPTALFAQRNRHELFTGGLRLHLGPHLSLGAAVEKRPAGASSTWSGLADVGLELGL